MENIINSTPFILSLNLLSYIVMSIAIKSLKIKFMNALLPAIALVIAAVLTLNIDYESYAKGSEMITFFLNPSVIALGYVLHKQVDKIKGNLLPIITSITVGAIVNLLIINLILLACGTDLNIIYSVQPKSVTTPIALSLSMQSGAIPSLTVIAVVFTGVLGSVVGSEIMRLCGIKNPISRGLAMGSAAHAVGTARALELGAVEGAMGGLAIGVMGLVTSLLLTFCRNIFV